MTKRARRATTKRSAAARQLNPVKRSTRAKRRNGVQRANGRKSPIEHRKTLAPSRKTLAATVGSAIAAVALYFANSNGTHAVPPEMASLVTVAATFAAGWLIPPGAREALIETERGLRSAVA
jgi:hypothetical protein